MNKRLSQNHVFAFLCIVLNMYYSFHFRQNNNNLNLNNNAILYGGYFAFTHFIDRLLWDFL